MALSPEIDALVARISGLEALVASLDGIQPIHVTIGSYTLIVDPVAMPEAYQRGSDSLKATALGAITDLRNAVATTAVMQSQAPSP